MRISHTYRAHDFHMPLPADFVVIAYPVGITLLFVYSIIDACTVWETLRSGLDATRLVCNEQITGQ
jgi:hypothetical protein